MAGNCHKEPAADFSEWEMTVEDILRGWQPLVERLAQAAPRLRVVFTVSPYRYVRYGLHGSQLGKAALLLAADRLCRTSGRCLYFPAYEIVVDELRDYRFYERDMLHPSAVAVDYVWEQLRRWSFTPELERYCDEWQAVRRDLEHRSLHPGSAEDARFRERTRLRAEAFERKWGPAVPPPPAT